MAAAHPASGGPVVSVVVPARNEEVSLGACLESLVAQTGLSREIIVVDDGSTDLTREIAESFSEVRVISAPPLPAGWTGKNNAMAAGAREACGEWLLFTDADTVHLPGSLARALEEVRQHGAAMLSYSPEQEVRGFWERAVMPVIFAELAVTFRTSQVSDPKSAAAAANGQYLLISRRVYDAVGGHAAIAVELLEDVALARAVKSSGNKIFFRYGADAVRTRMYRTFSQIREGWTKNLVLLFPSPVRLALLRSAEFLLIVGSFLATTVELGTGETPTGLVLSVLVLTVLALFVLRVHKAHFPPASYLLGVLGLPIFSYLLLRSRLSYKRGQVQWKGRTYNGGLANQNS